MITEQTQGKWFNFGVAENVRINVFRYIFGVPVFPYIRRARG